MSKTRFYFLNETVIYPGNLLVQLICNSGNCHSFQASAVPSHSPLNGGTQSMAAVALMNVLCQYMICSHENVQVDDMLERKKNCVNN